MKKLLTPFNVISLLLLLLILAWWYWLIQPPVVPVADTNKDIPKVEKKINLYFSDSELISHRIEERAIYVHDANPTELAQEALREWVAGPKNPEGVGLVASNEKVPLVYVREGHYVVDLPASWANLTYSASGELMLVCAMTKTLLGLDPENADVTFLLNGKETETLAGHLDLRDAFDKNSCPQ